jgi:hypothetical protein
MTQKKKTKSEHSWSFRKQAVEQYRLSGKSAAAIAQSLNIPDWKMRLWRQRTLRKRISKVRVHQSKL